MLEYYWLDILQITFWSITYVLIIVAGVQSRKIKKLSIPYSACLCNFCWEVCALISSKGFWGHIIWLGLDCIIVFIVMYFGHKKRYDIFSHIILGIVALSIVFKFDRGMLLSVFAIDLGMAISFLKHRKNLSPKLKITIAITKFLGDTFAGLFYYKYSIIILIIAVLVFIINIVYFVLCIHEKYDIPINHNLNSFRK